MKLQKIVERLQKLHPKEIDLSLDRTKNLCQKLGNPQDQINVFQLLVQMENIQLFKPYMQF